MPEMATHHHFFASSQARKNARLGTFASGSYAYILHILNHIGAADTLGEIEALLPWSVPQGIA
jgi:hypothetical protein